LREIQRKEKKKEREEGLTHTHTHTLSLSLSLSPSLSLFFSSPLYALADLLLYAVLYSATYPLQKKSKLGSLLTKLVSLPLAL
jgi:hypothetical protein